MYISPYSSNHQNFITYLFLQDKDSYCSKLSSQSEWRVGVSTVVIAEESAIINPVVSSVSGVVLHIDVSLL